MQLPCPLPLLCLDHQPLLPRPLALVTPPAPQLPRPPSARSLGSVPPFSRPAPPGSLPAGGGRGAQPRAGGGAAGGPHRPRPRRPSRPGPRGAGARPLSRRRLHDNPDRDFSPPAPGGAGSPAYVQSWLKEKLAEAPLRPARSLRPRPPSGARPGKPRLPIRATATSAARWRRPRGPVSARPAPPRQAPPRQASAGPPHQARAARPRPFPAHPGDPTPARARRPRPGRPAEAPASAHQARPARPRPDASSPPGPARPAPSLRPAPALRLDQLTQPPRGRVPPPASIGEEPTARLTIGNGRRGWADPSPGDPPPAPSTACHWVEESDATAAGHVVLFSLRGRRGGARKERPGSWARPAG